jgi:arabinofuranosyltransferase
VLQQEIRRQAQAIIGVRSLVHTSLALLSLLIIKDAWLCDDAYITFRTVDNAVHGYGFTWNVDERVQTYTHPLWMLLLTVLYFFIRNIYIVSLCVSLLLSIGAICIFALRLAKSPLIALVGLALLAASKTFVDFATSGLEDPLTYLLLACFVLVYLRDQQPEQRLGWLALLAGLLTLNRMDTLLLVAPALLFTLFKTRSWKGIRTLVLGFTPFLLWEAFSLFYYGFLFPNTAYAKLDTGIPETHLLIQGILYLISCAQFDPFLPLVFAATTATLLRSKERQLLPLAAGILLYVCYIVSIGGDFMAGRFLAAPLFLAVLLLGQYPALQLKLSWALVLVGAIGAAALCVPCSRWISNYSSRHLVYQTGVADERAFYANSTSLLDVRLGSFIPEQPWAYEGLQARLTGQRVTVFPNVGFYGFMAGPEVHVVDPLALCDPLLARLPTAPGWRIGHFRRDLPVGYLETLESGRNLIQDKALALYYSKLELVTRGSLFDPQRLVEIWKLNTGVYSSLLQAYTRHHSLRPAQAPSGIGMRLLNPTQTFEATPMRISWLRRTRWLYLCSAQTILAIGTGESPGAALCQGASGRIGLRLSSLLWRRRSL